jgi:hypothetical protein
MFAVLFTPHLFLPSLLLSAIILESVREDDDEAGSEIAYRMIKDELSRC